MRAMPDVTSIGDELATRAGLDPAWDAVLRAYLAGHADYPDPFTARPPKPARPSPDPPAA